MRYIQCLVTNKLIPADQYVRPSQSATIHDDLQPFISPVDGSIIGSNSALREHNRRNNVIQHLEYGGDRNLDAEKRKDAHHQGKRSAAEIFERKQEIYNHIIRAERENGRS